MAILTKRELYSRMAVIRREFGLSKNEPFSNPEKILPGVSNLKIAEVPFKTTALHGICSFGEAGQCDIILLNSHRPLVAQRFDCLHEFIHLHEHRNLQKTTFYCYDRVREKQNAFLEWQANEGAAELLIPYADFIPRFCSSLETVLKGQKSIYLQGTLADYYHVTPAVIDNRIRTLSYEIDQFREGVPVDRLRILSDSQQKRSGIAPTCYSALLDFSFDAVV